MVYGDAPINLHTYTYKPQFTAIAQAGNLYFYAINNPIAYHDASGEDAAVLALIAESGLDGLSLAGLGDLGLVGLGVVWVKSQVDNTAFRLTLANYASTSTSRGGGFTKETVRGGGFTSKSSKIDWGNINSGTKNHILKGTKGSHKSGWKKLGFDPNNPNSFGMLIPFT